MSTLLSTLPLIAAAMLAALIVTLALAGAVQMTSRRESAYVHLIFYAMLFVVAAGTLLTGRDLSTLSQLAAAPALPPLTSAGSGLRVPPTPSSRCSTAMKWLLPLPKLPCR